MVAGELVGISFSQTPAPPFRLHPAMLVHKIHLRRSTVFRSCLPQIELRRVQITPFTSRRFFHWYGHNV